MELQINELKVTFQKIIELKNVDLLSSARDTTIRLWEKHN